MYKSKITSLLLLLTLGLTACGSEPAEQPAAAPEAPAVMEASSGVMEVVIQPAGNELRFEQTTFSVKAGQEVKLIMDNTATMEAMQHNIVILSSNDDEVVARVGMAGMTAGDAAGYVPQDDPDVLAYTAVARPGEKKEVTFTAPTTPGTYRYICTFPGHYMVMQGTMVVS